MSNRIRLAVLAAATLTALVTAPAAHAEDQRPCVSLREFRGTDMQHAITRGELEMRWDVRGLGQPVANASGPQWNYRACGFGTNEVQVSIVTQPWTNIRVSTLNLKVVLVVRAKASGITLHGHARSTTGLLG